MSIIKKNKKSHLTKSMFLDEGVDIARYDQVKHSVIEKITAIFQSVWKIWSWEEDTSCR